MNEPAPLWRRFAAIFYDSLIVIALCMVAAALTLPFTDGEAVKPGNILMQLWLLTVALGFFVLFWKKDGQTLGMRAWKIRLISIDESRAPLWRELWARAFVAIASWACLGLGYWWSLFNAKGDTWHDKLSNTQLVRAG